MAQSTGTPRPQRSRLTRPAPTTRDRPRSRVGRDAVSLTARPIPFQAWRVRRRAGLGDSNDRTIRRTLTVMAEAGWLEHEPNSKWWHPGPKADERLDAA